MKKTILAVMLSTLALTACHDDDDDHHSPGNGGNPPPTTQQGVLTDGPIENVRYELNGQSNDSYVTDAEGKFTYNEGDKITFFIGDLQIGEEITAKARVTPVDLYEDDPEVEGNEDEELEEALTVFLQSIDSDADHDNGIQISDELIEKINSLEKTTFEELFDPASEESLVNQITTILTEQLEIPEENIVTPEQAAANLQAAFYKDIAGTWQLGSENKSDKVILVVYTDGSYKLGEADEPEDDGTPGYELGNLQWNWKGGVITPVIDENGDTNGTWGLSDSEGDEGYTLTFDGTNLVLTETGLDEDDTHTFTRVENVTDGLVGTWELNDTHVLVLLDDGYYFLIDTQGNTPGEATCGEPGIEYGKYTATNGTFTVTDNLFDTNEGCGLNDGETGVVATYEVEGDSLTLTPTGEEAVTFSRADFQRDSEPAPEPDEPEPTV